MRPLPFLPLLLLVAACELTEVTVAPGDPVVIVQAVLSARGTEQFVTVERSLTGETRVDTAATSIPPNEPRIPIGDALVVLTHEGPSSCTPAVDTLRPRSPASGVYVTAGFCLLEAGDRVRLRVETSDGTTVTGTTTVPGARSVSLRLAADSATAEGQVLDVDRERDTIRIAVDPILARALQVEVRWRNEPDSLEVYAITDTMGLALPADLVNPFVEDEGRPVFEVGREYTLGITVTDSSYFDFVRSFSDPFTGRGFLNRLDGGIGVFGSVATYRYYLRVVR